MCDFCKELRYHAKKKLMEQGQGENPNIEAVVDQLLYSFAETLFDLYIRELKGK